MNFDTTTTTVTMVVAAVPTPLIVSRHFQLGPRSLQWCTTMPACDSVKAVKRPTANSGTRALDIAAERDEQDTGCDGEYEDAIRQHETIAAVRELAREEAVGRDDAREPGEVGECRVRREREDHRGRRLEQPIERSGSKDRATHGREDRLVRAERRSQVLGEHRDTEEQRTEDRRHPRQGDRRVPGRGLPECLYPVRDRLDPLSATAPDENARSNRNDDAPASTAPPPVK